ncbi:hypothetical protein [Streptomyces sp. BH104]|uniref:hypothetical protein n=1 Tax=Streptomyces sp. BH104 TaxID=3410407 RepID=UPI003BB60842
MHAECEPDEVGDEPIGDEETGPEVRVFHRATGWVMTGSEPEECTTNFHRQQDGRSTCAETAVWKVVELNGLTASIGFYCDADLAEEHKPPQAA